MREAMEKRPWLVTAVGLILVIVGTLGANSQSLTGNPIQIIFDTGAVVGWVLLIGGVVMWARSRKSE